MTCLLRMSPRAVDFKCIRSRSDGHSVLALSLGLLLHLPYLTLPYLTLVYFTLHYLRYLSGNIVVRKRTHLNLIMYSTCSITSLKLDH